ncbi:MAG: bacillithiol system redox-active protein YtxJ [Acidobacteria bacterium]|nr:bacillithiol system redox-active protein YtxJ [Acidobacteriota bacterium]MBI3423650.1 bacillithiol system redox-active protein YtxJ [Acidobacteriota bacterium]
MPEYQELTSLAGLTDLLQASHQQPVLFFKHSNACPISSRALGEFEKYLASEASASVQHALIVVQTAREVSDQLERVTGIQHESPQAILVRNGRAVWDESHLAIKSDRLLKAVSKDWW